jgi:hypothetical protein
VVTVPYLNSPLDGLGSLRGPFLSAPLARVFKGTAMPKPPKLTKAELREQLEAALANYSGPVTHCPTGKTPQEDAEQREQRKFDRALRQIAQQQAAQRRRPAG